MRKQKNNSGITLIALVITIIVLLILAGVSINMVVGQNSVLSQAQNAVTATEAARVVEKIQMELVAKNVDGSYTIKDVQDVTKEITGNDMSLGLVKTDTGMQVDLSSVLSQTKKPTIVAGQYATEVSQYSDGTNTAIIPKGFTVSNVATEKTISSGLVIYQGDLSKADWTSSDLQKNYNQYVWIPCTEATFQRTEWEIEIGDPDLQVANDEYNLLNVSLADYHIENGITTELINAIVEQMDKEHASVKSYGGYYISRYEIGGTEDAAVSQKYETPYASIIWKKAYTEAMKIDVGTSAISYLCSSYARDTAINFIQNNSTFTNYATDRTGCNENWSDMEVSYVDESGTSQTKKPGTSTSLPTGVTLAKCNIYDLGGNVAEFTTELHPVTNGSSATVVLRGGSWYGTLLGYTSPAGSRCGFYPEAYNANKGFRTTLFIQ